METFDLESFLYIQIEVCYVVVDRLPTDKSYRIADEITDDDIREGIKRFFKDEEEWTEELLEPALLIYKETERVQLAIHRLCMSLFF